MNNFKRSALLGFSCLGAMLTVNQAQAEPTLYLGMNGGTMERLYADKVLPALRKPTTSKW